MPLQIKYLIYLLVIGLVLKTTQLLFTQQQFTIQIILLLIGLIFTGIPHGALDNYIAKKSANNNNNYFNPIFFIIRYIFLMLLYGLLWWVLPGLSLCLFIFLTAFHFGETDLHFFENTNAFKSFLYGLSLTAWLLLPHQTELIKWLQLIIPKTDTVFILTHFLFKIPPILFLLICSILSFPEKNKRTTWLLVILMLVLVNQLGLIGGFAFYFSGWHGWQAFIDIKGYLQSKENISQLWRKAIPFTLLALFFLLLIYFVTPSSVWQMYGAPAFIVMISLLTLPHIQVMHSIYSEK